MTKIKIKAAVKKDCFAYREITKEKDGFEWHKIKCDALNDLICERGACPFYKAAASLIMYEYKLNNIPGVGYMEK